VTYAVQSPSTPDISNVRDISHNSFVLPTHVRERDIGDVVTSHVEASDTPSLTFTIINGATSKSKPRLVSSHNHVYNFKKTLKNGQTVWQCSVRNKKVYCTAVVKQLDDMFVPGSVEHKCTPNAGAISGAKVRSQIQETAKSDTHSSGSEIVNKAIKANFPPTAPTDSLPQYASLVRGANRRRQGDRPQNPADLDFKVQNSAIPDDFLRGDIKVGQKRHFLFYTDNTKEYMAAAKEWYIDGTFKSVGPPFTQLWSIHVFLQHGESVKQVPVAFALMSGASTDDYKAVLERIINDVPVPELSNVILDFERAAWSAVHTVLPQVTCKGCHFHWTQAIWRKVQSLGLAADYMEKTQVQKFVRRLMCLPFLPHEHIAPMFVNIISLDTPANPMPLLLRQLFDYIQRTWIYSSVWPPESWSQFQRSVRTNNDCEGWHRRLNQKIHRHNLPFYQLIAVLHSEAELVDIQAQFLADDKLRRIQHKKDQGKIIKLWDKFVAEDITPKDLLREVSNVYTPRTKL